MGPGGPPGLQNRSLPASGGEAGFDSQALPPVPANTEGDEDEADRPRDANVNQNMEDIVIKRCAIIVACASGFGLCLYGPFSYAQAPATAAQAAALVAAERAAAAAAALGPARVYVYARGKNTAGFVGTGFKGRLGSADDLRAALKGSKVVRLVAAAEDADVTVEVMDREMVPTDQQAETRGEGLDHLLFGVRPAKTEPRVDVRLKVGTYSTVITGTEKGLLWHLAAQAAAKKIETWIKVNRVQIAKVAGRRDP